jgi:hypothetical protein
MRLLLTFIAAEVVYKTAVRQHVRRDRVRTFLRRLARRAGVVRRSTRQTRRNLLPRRPESAQPDLAAYAMPVVSGGCQR